MSPTILIEAWGEEVGGLRSRGLRSDKGELIAEAEDSLLTLSQAPDRNPNTSTRDRVGGALAMLAVSPARPGWVAPQRGSLGAGKVSPSAPLK